MQLSKTDNDVFLARDENPEEFDKQLNYICDRLPMLIDNIREELGKQFQNTLKPMRDLLKKAVLKEVTKPSGMSKATKQRYEAIREEWEELLKQKFTPKVISEMLAERHPEWNMVASSIYKAYYKY